MSETHSNAIFCIFDYKIRVIYKSKVFESIISTIIKEFICHIKQ